MSQTTNPYAAQVLGSSHVESPDPGVQPVNIFSTKGRIGRVRYLAYSFVAYVLFVLVGLGVSSLLGTGETAVVYAILLGYVVFAALLTIQRSHDMGWSGWTAILAFIPMVGLVWLVMPGTARSNRFGAPTPPNTWPVIIGGLVIPLIVGVGMIAAIALPAYHDYVTRAKAAQVLKR